MAYQVESPVHTFFGNSGQLLAGGYLKFFEADTVTPKSVYADSGLTITNGATVPLDASGRPNEACWGSGSYYLEVYDQNDVKQGENTATDPAGAALNIPIPNTGEFLTGDGAQILAQLLTLIPDPTGFAGKFLGTDGTEIVWQAGPDAPEAPTIPTFTSSSSSFQIAGYLFQLGTGSAAPTGGHRASASITFPTAFSAAETPKVFITPTIVQASSYGFIPAASAPSVTATGFSAAFDTNEGSSSGALTNTVTFNWMAFGKAA